MSRLEKIAAYRVEHGVGLREARDAVMRQERAEELAQLRQSGDVGDKINWLLDRYEEQFLKSN
jgi:hypothetical protein